MSERYVLRIPARVNILGNPTDANEGDFATISAAVNIYAGATVEECDEYLFQWIDRDKPMEPIDEYRTAFLKNLDFDDGDPMMLFKGAMRYLFREYPRLRKQLGKQGIKIAIWTDVPRQSGLGGSSLPILLILEGVRRVYDLSPTDFNPYAISEIAQRIEEKELQITCGFADRYVPHFGGMAYLDYRGKLYHKTINEEPYATYERLDPFVPDTGFIVVSSGVPHDSGDVHSVMRTRYLEDTRRLLEEGAAPSSVLEKFRLVGDTAWRGKIALLRSDLNEFGNLMNENHRLVNEIMYECGFTHGAGEANNLFINTALEGGALGAKLSGAGGGGSVLVFAERNNEDRVVEALEKTIKANHYDSARILKVSVDRAGLKTVAESVE